MNSPLNDPIPLFGGAWMALHGQSAEAVALKTTAAMDVNKMLAMDPKALQAMTDAMKNSSSPAARDNYKLAIPGTAGCTTGTGAAFLARCDISQKITVRGSGQTITEQTTITMRNGRPGSPDDLASRLPLQAGKMGAGRAEDAQIRVAVFPAVEQCLKRGTSGGGVAQRFGNPGDLERRHRPVGLGVTAEAAGPAERGRHRQCRVQDTTGFQRPSYQTGAPHLQRGIDVGPDRLPGRSRCPASQRQLRQEETAGTAVGLVLGLEGRLYSDEYVARIAGPSGPHQHPPQQCQKPRLDVLAPGHFESRVELAGGKGGLVADQVGFGEQHLVPHERESRAGGSGEHRGLGQVFDRRAVAALQHVEIGKRAVAPRLVVLVRARQHPAKGGVRLRVPPRAYEDAAPLMVDEVGDQRG